MKEFEFLYDKSLPKGVKCVYKITIGEYFYYGSTTDFVRRASYYQSNFRRNTVLLNKNFRSIIKTHNSGFMDIVFSSDNFEVVKIIENQYIEKYSCDPKSMNRAKSAYNNSGLKKYAICQ